MLAPKRERQVGSWKKLQNKEYNSCSSASDNFSMTKPKRRRWAGQEAPGERSNTHNILLEKH
jgi:hypothetical protein